MRKFIALCGCMLLSGCGASARWQVPGPLALRPGDAVRLEVPDAPQLGGEFVISNDGMTLLPLIGLVEVAGQPFIEVSRSILASYSNELVDTPVRVTPVLRIAVLGEVRQPGHVPADPTFTLSDVIAAAGGLTPSADAAHITLVRGGESRRLSLDEGADVLSQPLAPGDQVIVARRSWVRENLNVLVGAAASVVAAAVTSLILR